MYVKSQGIILKTFPFQENDLILKVLTPDKGLISLIYKGKQKQATPISPLLYAEFIYIEKQNSNLHRLNEASTLDAFIHLRDSYDALQAAFLLLEALLKTQMEGKPAPALFELLIKYLKCLSTCKNPEAIASSFFLKLLRHEGLFNLSSTCTECKEPLSELTLFEGESYCKTHAPSNALNYNFEESEKMIALAFGRSFDDLLKIDCDPIFFKKIHLLFLDTVCSR